MLSSRTGSRSHQIRHMRSTTSVILWCHWKHVGRFVASAAPSLLLFDASHGGGARSSSRGGASWVHPTPATSHCFVSRGLPGGAEEDEHGSVGGEELTCCWGRAIRWKEVDPCIWEGRLGGGEVDHMGTFYRESLHSIVFYTTDRQGSWQTTWMEGHEHRQRG